MSRNFRTPVQTNVDPTVAGWFTPVLAQDGEGISITINQVSGTVNGTFKLQSTDFDGTDARTAPASTSSDWVDYPGSTNPAAAANITAAINWQITEPRAKWWQVVFTNGASSSPKIKFVTMVHAWQPIG